jgi:hypothetical protein
VPSRKVTNFRLAPELLDALYVIKERDGLSLVHQVRRALYDWIVGRGVTIEVQQAKTEVQSVKTDRLRARTRKRP